MNRYFVYFALITIFIAPPATLTAQPADSTAVYLFPGEKPVTHLAIWKTRQGDSSAWSNPGYDDSRWGLGIAGSLWPREGAPGKGIVWYRQTLFIPEPLDTLQALAIYQRAVVCASELYWDGALLSRNGKVGATMRDEMPGRSAQFTVVPPHLALPGRHVVALRVSNAHTFSGLMETPLQIGYFPLLSGRLHVTEALLLLCAGIFFITAVFHAAVLRGRTKGLPYAIFSVLCLSSAVYLLIDTAVHYFPFGLRHYYAVALVNDIPWFCMMTLLPVFFLFEFAMPRRRTVSGAIAAAALGVIVPPRLIMFGLLPVSWLGAFVVLNQFYMYAAALFSTAVSLANIVRKKSGSLLALAGCALLFAGIFISFQKRVEYAWALGFCGLIVLLTVSLSRQMAEQNRKRQESELKSARLELELLKKHIQPHFLLNSLNSIIAWLEENPATATRLVNALAEELRLVLDFSKEKLVPIADEFRLCRLHLEVMGLRRDKQYTLAAAEVPREEKIPPLVFHTLVENGLTHGCAGKNGGAFVFRRETLPHGLRYSLFNDWSAGGSASKTNRADGTGLRYVKMRLEEAFPGAWNLRSGPAQGGWEVSIELLSTDKKR
ncbi:MAG TPA: histidine kinase [Chitinivibrionales bacterium]|nr:histidine kinase [Chitinivibrionales bacterium]